MHFPNICQRKIEELFILSWCFVRNNPLGFKVGIGGLNMLLHRCVLESEYRGLLAGTERKVFCTLHMMSPFLSIVLFIRVLQGHDHTWWTLLAFMCIVYPNLHCIYSSAFVQFFDCKIVLTLFRITMVTKIFTSSRVISTDCYVKNCSLSAFHYKLPVYTLRIIEYSQNITPYSSVFIYCISRWNSEHLSSSLVRFDL